MSRFSEVFILMNWPRNVSHSFCTTNTMLLKNLLSQIDVELQTGGYLGFTAHSGFPGPANTPADKLSERALVWAIETFNLNPNMLGEEPSSPQVKDSKF